ncbi:MAG TPA: hypothetical protein VGO90_01585 [Chthoniobacteraceae bacterium]|jgi:hypothetical protein|nr:hypothetical protein [Chthoniobacteraceae bacterium]
METPEHQEWRSRQRISPRAIVTTALVAGLITFVFSGGAPWTTAGTMNSVMGRVVKWNFIALIVGHFAVALIYMGVIASAIYRFRVVTAIIVGVAVGFGLYGLNYVLFNTLGLQEQSPESRTIMTHVAFSLFSSVLYKAISVPRPLAAVDKVA